MATLEDIVAASKILSENPESTMGASGSKGKENGVRVSDVKNDDGGSAADAVVSERDMEFETVLESTFDEERENIGVGSLSRVPYGSSGVEVNGIDVRMDADSSRHERAKSGEKDEIGENSLANEGEDRSTGNKQLNGNGRDGVFVDADGDGDRKDGIDEELKDHVNKFRVGDFVWGKIRSHPWWPGQVYDAKNASEIAMKYKQEGRILVAFLGDGSCSWCSASQLIPFVENFSEMSTDGSSKSFLNAVQSAVDEVGRLVELEMTCNCVPKVKKDSLSRQEVANAGLKDGVVVPEVDVRRLSVPEYEPAEVLEKVMQLARTVHIDNALDLAILRSWLSAFYYLKGGYVLPEYQGLLHIEGLEDRNKNVNEVSNDFSVPIEVPILGPKDDDWLSSPTVGSLNSGHPLEDKVSHKRKHRSVAEILGDDKNIKPENRRKTSVKEGTDFEKSASSRKRKKNNDGELDRADSEQAASKGKTGRKRKVEALESPKITNAKDLNAERGGTEGADGVNGGPLLGKPKKIQAAVTENASGGSKEESETVASPRERKKSKYLSPPYTNPAWRMGNSSSWIESEVEHDKTTKVARVGENEKEATGDDVASQPISKSIDNASQEKLPNGKPEKLNMSDYTSPHTIKNDKKLSFSVSDVDAPVEELLSDIQHAALDRFYLSTKGSVDVVYAFASAFRSSTYSDGQDHKIFRKCKADGNKKSLPSQLENLGNELSDKKAKSPDQGTSKALKRKRKSDTAKSKKAAETSVVGNTMETVECKTLPCLILEFASGFPLPSKKDIVNLFGKFGSLNKKETKVEKDSHSIRIVYMLDSDAEAAFKSSLSESPFGSENVNFRLQRSSAGSKSRKSHPKVSSPLKQASGKRKASHEADDLVSNINIIRQKLEITTAIVENYHPKFSAQDKSSLKDEVKDLMEKIETISEKVRIMAEKTSS